MDLKWLETFVIVARRGTMSAAATDLGYSRSTVTHHVQNLERAFGVQLLDRGGGGGGPTSAGYVLLGHAEEVLRRLGAARTQMIRSASGADLTLRLGATEMVSIYRLPPVLHLLQRVVPNVTIAVEVASAKGISDQLRIGRLDVALTTGVRGAAGLPSRVLCQEEVVVVSAAGPGAKWAARRVLVPQRGCVYREIAEVEYLPQVPGAELVQLGSLEAVKSAVLARLGVGLVPLVAVRQQLRQGQLALAPWRPRSRVTTQVTWNDRTCPEEVVAHLLRIGTGGRQSISGGWPDVAA